MRSSTPSSVSPGAAAFVVRSAPSSSLATSTAAPSAPAAAAASAALAASPRTHMIAAGLVSGVCTAGLFNPWDRALYLSVLHSRPFLSRLNFSSPYQGFMQVVLHRTLSGGLYFPLFDMSKPAVQSAVERLWPCSGEEHSSHHASEQRALLHFLCGNLAGASSGVLLNGLTAVKYHSWDYKTGFFASARAMYAAGGLQPFTKGISATVTRDTVFGGCFAWTKFILAKAWAPRVRNAPSVVAARGDEPAARLSSGTIEALQATVYAPTQAMREQSHVAPVSAHRYAVHPSSPSSRVQLSAGTVDFTAALFAGLFATMLSSPFNYVRNIKYGWPSDSRPPSSFRILLDLARETKASGRAAGHLQERLRLGWGTARVAVGMAVGQLLYEATKRELDRRHAPKHAKQAAEAALKQQAAASDKRISS